MPTFSGPSWDFPELKKVMKIVDVESDFAWSFTSSTTRHFPQHSKTRSSYAKLNEELKEEMRKLRVQTAIKNEVMKMPQVIRARISTTV